MPAFTNVLDVVSNKFQQLKIHSQTREVYLTGEDAINLKVVRNRYFNLKVKPIMKVAHDKNYYSKKQKWLLVWTAFAIILLVAGWNISILGQLFGFETYWAYDNFVFLFPVMIVSLVIVCCTCGLTIVNWRRLPNKNISIITVILSLWMISSITYNFTMLL
jgi:hypothetical protein